MGEAVLFVHGLASTYASNWERYGWPDLLSEVGRVAVPVELPGHGHSAVPPEEAAADVAEVWARRESSGATEAVGFSAGAVLLLRAAAERPDAFERIVLMGIGDGIWNARRPGLELGTALMEGADGDTGPALFSRIARAAGNDPRLVGAYARSATPAPAPEALRAVAADVLIVLGEQDMTGAPDLLAASLPRATVEMLPGTDHFATPSDPRAFAAVQRFLSCAPGGTDASRG